MWVRPLGWEDPLEEGMATHSSILAKESHGQRSLAGYHEGAKSQTQLKLLSTYTETKRKEKKFRFPYLILIL